MSTRARESWCKARASKLGEPVKLAFCHALLAEDKLTEHSAEKALIRSVSVARKWSQYTRRLVAAALRDDPLVLAEFAKARDEGFVRQLVGKHERRAMLAPIVRAGVAPDKVRPVDLVAAARLDAELAGDLSRGGGAVAVQVGVSVGGDLHALMREIRRAEPVQPVQTAQPSEPSAQPALPDA